MPLIKSLSAILTMIQVLPGWYQRVFCLLPATLYILIYIFGWDTKSTFDREHIVSIRDFLSSFFSPWTKQSLFFLLDCTQAGKPFEDLPACFHSCSPWAVPFEVIKHFLTIVLTAPSRVRILKLLDNRNASWKQANALANSFVLNLY